MGRTGRGGRGGRIGIARGTEINFLTRDSSGSEVTAVLLFIKGGYADGTMRGTGK